MQCTYINKFRERCEHVSYNGLDVCVLHCAEKDIEESNYEHYRECFYNFFSKYIFEEVNKKLIEALSINDSLTMAEIQSRKNDLSMFSKLIKDIEEVEVSSSLKENLRKIDLTVYELKFPKDLVMNSFNSNAKIILKNLGKVLFVDCEFNTPSMALYAEFYYENCRFNENIKISPFPDLKDGTKYRYKYCIFKDNVEVTDSTHSNEINSNLFKECLFNGTVVLKNVNFQKNVFDFPKFNKNFIAGGIRRTYSEYKKYYIIKELEIENCAFKLNFKFNGFDKENIDVLVEEGYHFEKKDLGISSIHIIDSKFNSKFEMKNRALKAFEFKNSNVKGIFDAFASEIEETYFYKSIFEDFAGFEKVYFGIKGNYKKEYIAEFIYTTFMSFSNFRETKFHSGLDFERVNLKENPNFLKATVSQENTNRETFRIIKHSFDSIGNQIEANRFFIMEMKKYKSDLKDAVSKSGDIETKSELLVLNLNEFFSYFGASYVRPTVILIVVTIPYAIMRYIHEWFYYDNIKSYPKFIEITGLFFNGFAKGFQPVSKFLVSGMEFFSLLYYIAFSLLLWQIIVSVKRKVKR